MSPEQESELMGAILGGQNINQGLGRPPGPNFEAMPGFPV